MRFRFIASLLLILAFVHTLPASDTLEKTDKVNPHNNVGIFPGGLRIRGFSFELVPAKKNYFVVTIYYHSGPSGEIRHTIALRQGDYFPESEEYEITSIAARSATIGSPDTGMAAIVVTDATIRHRQTGAIYRLRDDGGTKLVERLKKA